MKPDDFERISGYAKTAMRLLKKSHIPAIPQFYELLYTYATGVSPDLNKRINALLKKGSQPTEELIELLHKEFIDSGDFSDRLSQVSSEMSERISSVHGAIAQANASANSYSGLLQSATGDLAGGVSSEHLASLTDNLLQETRKMQTTNSALEDRLDTARDHIANLQQELEAARRENMIDPLTKISNRKAFDRAMDTMIQDAVSKSQIFSLIMLDIDHFKKFNDSFGHTTGDQVLRLVGSTLETQTKDVDLAARYGGEEFAVILPGAKLGEAVEVAERLRLGVRSRQLLKRSTQESLGKISASFGVAEYQPGDSATSIIDRADACLYAAKNNGRNQVVSELKLAELTVKNEEKDKSGRNHAA